MQFLRGEAESGQAPCLRGGLQGKGADLREFKRFRIRGPEGSAKQEPFTTNARTGHKTEGLLHRIRKERERTYLSQSIQRGIAAAQKNKNVHIGVGATLVALQGEAEASPTQLSNTTAINKNDITPSLTLPP